MPKRPVLIAAVLALLAGATAMKGANASLASRNGRIAYAHLTDDGRHIQIFTTTPSGTPVRKLTTSHTYSSFAPSYSPDGRRIVFTRTSKSRRADLWTMHADGSHERRLTSTKVADVAPTWSPNGKEIAFAVSGPPQAKDGIWLIRADGSHRRRLASGCWCDGGPAWSPDGTEIVFERFYKSAQISKIFVIPVGGGVATELSSDTDPGVSDWGPAWSPDGTRILFTSDRPDGFGADLWVMGADGSDVRQVTNTVDLDEDDAAWSPDGRQIVYTGVTQHNWQVFVSDADGGNSRKLTHGCDLCDVQDYAPSWQPLP